MRSKTAGKLPEDSKKHSFSKGDARYWGGAGRLFKDHGVADYSCRFTVRGQRAQICLDTSNQKEAAKRAAALYQLVSREGWEAGFALYRSQETPSPPAAVSVGMLIEAATKVSSARSQTLEGYAKAFRLIVAEISKISSAGKFDAYQGGMQNWRAKVDAVAMDTITPAEILAWKNKRLRSAEADPLAKRRAIVTVNSLMRNAKSLFGKKLLPFVEQSITLPRPLPFDGVSLEKEPSLRYISKIDPFAILSKAREELAETKPEAFKVMILALVCGLRRAEIDNLLWRAFDFAGSSMRVESSEFHELKSEDSAGKMDLDADTLALFRGYRANKPKAVFVVESPLKHDSKGKVGRYRCKPVFDTVIAWLRKNGVDGHKPLHTLRKEIGSIIASEHGIFAASRYLRHADIHITSAFYADKKKTITPKAFAGLLSPTLPATSGESETGDQTTTDLGSGSAQTGENDR
jgi:integrase